MKIKRIKIFANNNEKSLKLKKEVEEKLRKNGFIIDNNKFDLGIAIGGDGSFLRMIKDNNFDSDTYYIGINAGTLGFSQEVEISDIEKFMIDLKSDKFLIEEIGIQETNIYSENLVDKFYSLNEIVVREKGLNTLKLDVYIDNYLLEKFAGDGINNIYDGVDKIETIIKDKTIKCLRNKNYNFIKKVNEKFII